MTAEATFNEKLLEVQKPFLEKVSGRRRQKLTVDLGFQSAIHFENCLVKIEFGGKGNIGTSTTFNLVKMKNFFKKALPKKL